MGINLKNKILLRKRVLSILLKHLSHTNSLVIYVSQDLDKLIVLYQKRLYSNYIKRFNSKNDLINKYKRYLMTRRSA